MCERDREGRGREGERGERGREKGIEREKERGGGGGVDEEKGVDVRG